MSKYINDDFPSLVEKVNDQDLIDLPGLEAHTSGFQQDDTDDVEKSVFSADHYRDSKIFFEEADSILEFLSNSSDQEWEKPVYDPTEWAFVYECDTRLRRATDIRVTNIVGNGWRIDYALDIDKMSKSQKRQADVQKAELENLFNFVDKSETFAEKTKKSLIDREATGQGFIEVIRNLSGQIISPIKHVQGAFVRIRKRKDDPNPGFISLEPISNDPHNAKYKKTYYKEFGDKRTLNKETGLFNASAPLDKQASELIPFFIYCPGIKSYGAPRAVTTKNAIKGNYLAGVQNVSLLENDATPRMAITVENGNIDTATIQKMEQFFKVGNKGPKHEGRVLIIQHDKKKIGLPNQNIPPTKINITPLSLGVIDDASFEKFRGANNAEKAESIGVPELMLGTTDGSGKAASSAVVKLFHEQVVYPDINEFNTKINLTIVKDFLFKRREIPLSHKSNVSLYESVLKYKEKDFKIVEQLDFFDRLDYLKTRMSRLADKWIFKEIDDSDKSNIVAVFENTPLVKFSLVPPTTTDPLESARVARLYHELASLTPNDVLRERGQNEYTELWADRPVTITELMLKHGVDIKQVFGKEYDKDPTALAPAKGAFGKPLGKPPLPVKKKEPKKDEPIRNKDT